MLCCMLLLMFFVCLRQFPTVVKQDKLPCSAKHADAGAARGSFLCRLSIVEFKPRLKHVEKNLSGCAPCTAIPAIGELIRNYIAKHLKVLTARRLRKETYQKKLVNMLFAECLISLPRSQAPDFNQLDIHVFHRSFISRHRCF